eukprot:2144130-Pyramimonas_sp.AAC.1
MPNRIWNDGGPAESTTLVGQNAINNGEHMSSSNMGWPQAASYTPPEATTIWGSPRRQGDDVFDSGTDTDARSPLPVPKALTGQTYPPVMMELHNTFTSGIIAQVQASCASCLSLHGEMSWQGGRRTRRLHSKGTATILTRLTDYDFEELFLGRTGR